MSTPPTHQVTVNIAAGSLAQLIGVGATLYALHGFETSNRSAMPLVAYANADLAATQTWAWAEDYQAFVSRTALSAGVGDPAQRKIQVGASTAVRLGQTVDVDASLQLTVSAGAPAGAIAFNSTADALTCGLAYGAGAAPACAVTLVAGLSVVIAPAQCVFLMFSTSAFELGAWVEQSSGDGLLVDMTGADARAVTFDLTAAGGWIEADQAWARAVAAGTGLPGLLRTIPSPNIPHL